MQKIALALIVVVVAFSMLAAQTSFVAAQVGGTDSGRTVGTVAAAVSKTIETNTQKQLAFLLTASGGNFGSKFGLVSVSVDGTNFVLVDNVTLGTNTVIAKNYSDAHLATTVAVNPVLFPFVKIATSAGNTGVTETITWTVQR
jgi:hypothetical protein